MAVRKRKGDAPTPEEAVAAAAPEPKTTSFERAGGHLGITLSNMDGVGVAIDEAHPADLCAKAGLTTGTVIVAVNGQAVSTHEECLPLLDGADGTVTVSYLTKADAEKEKASVDEKYRLKWAWFDWKPKLLIVLIIGALAVFGGPPAYKAVTSKLAEMEKMAAQNQEGGAAGNKPKAPEKREPLTDPFLLSVEKRKLDKLLDEFAGTPTGQMMANAGGKNGGYSFVDNFKKRYTADDAQEDPRDGIDMLNMLSQEAAGMAGMKEKMNGMKMQMPGQ